MKGTNQYDGLIAWQDGQPNNVGDNQECGDLVAGVSTFDDTECGNLRESLCQYGMLCVNK